MTRCILPSYPELLAVAVAIGTMGCVTPVLHPLRATNGWVGEVASSLQLNSGKQWYCYDGCSRGDYPFSGGSPAQGSFGYSRVISNRFGAMAGLYFPAFQNQKNSFAFGALWTYFTVQNDYVAAGIGPEIGLGNVAMMVGFEVQPLGIRRWTPAIGVYSRGSFPFVQSDSFMGGLSNPSVEYGARVRYGPVFLQYAYYRHMSELVSQMRLIESSTYSEGFQILTVGMTFDAITKLAIQ